VLDLLNADVSVPDYTTLCKRSADLEIAVPSSQSDEPEHIVMDSTGLKIYGEGEWKVR
jgi:IS5 family transposase